KPAESKPLEKKPAPQERPIVVAEKKPMPEAPRQGISPMLIILLVLAIGGAGAYFAWRYLIRGKTETSAKVTPPPVTPASGSVAAPTPPPAPVQPKAKIEIAAGAPRDILGVFAGNIESIDVTERDVDTSDILAKLVGAKRLEADIANLDKEIERRKATVKAAEDARAKLNPAPAEGSAEQPKAPSEAQVKAADALVAKTMKALEDKQNERVTKEENLEKLYVRAPAEGKVTILAKQGQKIEENVPVAKFTPKPAPTAMFKLEKNMTMDRGLAVPIKVGEKMYTCEVADSTVDGTRVVCRMNAEGLAEGAEATLMVEQQQ
nr:efflux RND transporter periplasmic adaptor subunit [Deltaproteobacteria bacterium]